MRNKKVFITIIVAIMSMTSITIYSNADDEYNTRSMLIKSVSTNQCLKNDENNKIILSQCNKFDANELFYLDGKDIYNLKDKSINLNVPFYIYLKTNDNKKLFFNIDDSNGSLFVDNDGTATSFFLNVLLKDYLKNYNVMIYSQNLLLTGELLSNSNYIVHMQDTHDISKINNQIWNIVFIGN